MRGKSIIILKPQLYRNHLSMFRIFLVLGSRTQVPEGEDRELQGFGALPVLSELVWSVIPDVVGGSGWCCVRCCSMMMGGSSVRWSLVGCGRGRTPCAGADVERDGLLKAWVGVARWCDGTPSLAAVVDDAAGRPRPRIILSSLLKSAVTARLR